MKKPKKPFDPESFLNEIGVGRTLLALKKNDVLFTQGEPADAVFYIREGNVKLTVVSHRGKEATIALLAGGDFAGEACVAAGEHTRLCTATALTRTSVLRIDKKQMVRALKSEQSLAELFVAFLLQRNAGIQAALVDQLFNSTEKRLARVLLLLTQFGKDAKSHNVIPKMSQELLAEMIGTTRSRVNVFMNRFRKLGYIDYNGELQVNTSLLHVVLDE